LSYVPITAGTKRKWDRLERDFKGVWIPREIWLDKELGWTEKMLLVEIDSLSKLGECFATNEYFGEFFNLSKDRISKVISSLIKKHYIESKLTYKPGTKQIEKRVITTIAYMRNQLEGIGENIHRGIGENNEDNNTTLLNKTINKTINISLVDFFESIWKLYPRREGKGGVSKTQKEKLHKIGIEEMTRAISRYIKAKVGEDKKYLQMGSTFFNSGYVDYLDINYQDGGLSGGNNGSKSNAINQGNSKPWETDPYLADILGRNEKET